MIWLWLGLAILAVYAAFLGALFLFQHRMLYLPNRNAPDLQAAEAVAGTALQARQLQTGDGLTLLAWYLPPPRPDAFVVLHLHGNAGNLANRAPRLRLYAEQGWGALVVEYRGFGGNSGTPTEAGLTLDAETALAALQADGVMPNRLLLWGESLGTNLAVKLAVKNPVAAVLLESPYTSITAIAQGMFPYVPVRLLLRDRYDTLSRIAAVQAPIFIMQGGRDNVVPPAMGRTLLAAIRAPKDLWLAPQAGHRDLRAAGAIPAAAAFVAAHLTDLAALHG